MPLTSDQLEILTNKFIEGKINDEELSQLNEWINQNFPKTDLSETINDVNSLYALKVRMHSKINESIQNPSKEKKTFRIFTKIAASIIFISLIITHYYSDLRNNNNSASNNELNVKADTIYSANTGATLTLPNGEIISLDKNENELTIKNGKTFYSNTQTEILDSKNLNNNKTNLFTIKTSQGKTLAIVLEDGTKVWLNANSSITYPIVFNNNDRTVDLTGEAYFDVKKNQKKPFKVILQNSEVEVLGTSFNISSYTNSNTTATLVEGAIKINQNHLNNTTILKPKEQALIGKESIHVNKVDTYPYTAWREGLFYFNGISAKEVISQISAWYDLDLNFRANITYIQFYGVIDRNKSLGAILSILEKSDIKFNLTEKNGRKTLDVSKT